MATSDLCDYCLCVCLAEPHVGILLIFIVQPPLSHKSDRAMHRNRSPSPLRECTHANTLPYVIYVSNPSRQ